MSEMASRATLYVSAVLEKSDPLGSVKPFSSGDRCKDMVGYQRIEATQVQYEIVPSMQDEQGVRVQFIPRGKRQVCEIVEDSDPTLVILDGWGHPEIQPWYDKEIDSRTGAVLRKARYPFAAEEWQQEFDEFLQKYLAESSSLVLADYRRYITKQRAYLTSVPTADVQRDEHRTIERNGEKNNVLSADEVVDVERFVEGATKQILVNAYERNPKARKNCISYYGTSCMICGFDFGATYGEIGEDYVHIHHLIPLSDISAEYEVDPIRDLRPVCANCHAMIHRRAPPFTLDEMRGFLKPRRV